MSTHEYMERFLQREYKRTMKKMKPKKFHAILDHGRPFWTILDHFRPSWTISDHIGQFKTIVYLLRPYWTRVS